MIVRRLAIAAGFCAALLAFTGCTKDESKPRASSSGSQELMKKLPADTLGFMSANMADPGFQAYIQSQAYRNYLAGMQAALATLKTQQGGYDTYMKVLEALGIMPKEGKSRYSDGLIFVAPKEGSGLDLAAYYSSAPGSDPRTFLAAAKTIMTEGKIGIEPVKGSSYEGLIVKPFNGSVDPAAMLYRDKLGLDTFYLGANESMLVVATSKQLLERGFAPGANEAQALFDGTSFKKAKSSLGNRSSETAFAYADLATIIRRTAPTPDADKIPLTAIAFSVSMETPINADVALITEPKGADQETVFGALTGAGLKGASLSKLPQSSALAFSLDGSVIARELDANAKTMPAPVPPEILDTLRKIELISLGVRPSTVGSPYPDIYLNTTSKDAAGLLAHVKTQRNLMPLPQGMAWQNKTDGGISFDFVQTPLGIGVYMGASGDAFAIASNEATLKEVLKADASSSLGTNVIIKSLADTKTPALLSAYINYANLMAMVQTTMSSLMMFAPQNPGFDPKQLDYMKHIGEIAVSIGYDPGVVRMRLTHQLPPA